MKKLIRLSLSALLLSVLLSSLTVISGHNKVMANMMSWYCNDGQCSYGVPCETNSRVGYFMEGGSFCDWYVMSCYECLDAINAHTLCYYNGPEYSYCSLGGGNYYIAIW